MASFGSTWLYLEILTGITIAAIVFFLLGIITGYLLWYRYRFQNLAIQKEMDASENRATGLHRKIEELNNRLRQHRQSDLDLKDQIREQKDAIELADVNRQTDQQTIASLQRKVETLERERDDLAQTVSQLRRERERFDSVDAELKAADHQVASLTEELRETHDRATRLDGELDLIRSIKAQFQAIQEDKEILRLELETAKLQTLDVASRLKAEMHEIQRQKHSLNAQNLQLQDDLELLRERYDSLLPSSSSSRTKSRRSGPSASAPNQDLENSLFPLNELHSPKDENPDPGDTSIVDSTPESYLHPELGLLFNRPPQPADDLGKIKGVGKILTNRLHDLGIYRFSQIAAWTDLQTHAFSKQLNLKDKVERDDWRNQCRRLMEG